MATELEQIRNRLTTRADLDRKDRERMAAILKQKAASKSSTWDEMCAEAGISRQTLSEILHGKRERRRPEKKPESDAASA